METNKLNKKILVILASILLAAAIIVLAIYYYLGIGFGNVVVNTAKGIRAAKMAYLLRHQIGTWALIYSIFASCSGNDNRSDYPHKSDSKLVSEVKTNPGSLCDAMEWLFSQKCVRETSKLTSSNQEVNTVLVQEDNELICIEIISEGVEIVFKPTSLTLDAFRESPYKKEKGVKYFYLSQVIDNDNSGVVEIIYPYSGNIYKLTATKQESAWVNIDFFCANY